MRFEQLNFPQLVGGECRTIMKCENDEIMVQVKKKAFYTKSRVDMHEQDQEEKTLKMTEVWENALHERELNKIMHEQTIF